MYSSARTDKVPVLMEFPLQSWEKVNRQVPKTQVIQAAVNAMKNVGRILWQRVMENIQTGPQGRSLGSKTCELRFEQEGASLEEHPRQREHTAKRSLG